MKQMLDKMQMPKKAGEDDEMLALEEGDMENEGEMPASGMDLSAATDDDLLMEMKKRGLSMGGESESGTEIELNMGEEA